MTDFPDVTTITDTDRLDYLTDMCAIVTSSRDHEVFGVAQVERDDTDLVTRILVPIQFRSERDAIDTAIHRWNRQFSHLRRYGA